MSITRLTMVKTYNRFVAPAIATSAEVSTKAATMSYFIYGFTLGQPATVPQLRTGITGLLRMDFSVSAVDTRKDIVEMVGHNLVDIGGYFDDVAEQSHIAWKANMRYAALFANWLGDTLAHYQPGTKAQAWENLAVALQQYSECGDFKDYIVYLGDKRTARVGLKMATIARHLQGIDYILDAAKDKQAREDKEREEYLASVAPVFTPEMRAEMEANLRRAFESFFERMERGDFSLRHMTVEEIEVVEAEPVDEWKDVTGWDKV